MYYPVRQGSFVFDEQSFSYQYFNQSIPMSFGTKYCGIINEFLKNRLWPETENCEVRYQFQRVSIQRFIPEGYKINLNSGQIFYGQIVYRLLRNCNDVIISIFTISEHIFADNLENLIADNFYNTLLQQSSDLLRDAICKEYNLQQTQLTRRYAPGYCGWPLQNQAEVVKYFPIQEMGVSITEHFMLNPLHSITGVFGVRKREKIREKIPCYTCTSITCFVHDDFQKDLPLLQIRA